MFKKYLISTYCLFLMASCTQDSNVETQPDSSKSSAKVAATGAANIAGLNWADGRDNFVDGWIIPSGLTANDSYDVVTAKTSAILNGFSSQVKGVNTIRIAINPSTVNSEWWDRYSGVIDKATSKGWNVIIACWEAKSSLNGIIDDNIKFLTMWNRVVVRYYRNRRVYFEPFNEPHGYSLSQLTTIYKQFLDRYPKVARERIILDGHGYAENVTGVGADERFDGCLLGLHNYAFWANRTAADWQKDWRNKIGKYGSRTVITEFGVPMNNGKDYQNGDQRDNEIAFIVATSDVCREDKIASVYWSGLRDGDSFSLLKRGGRAGVSISTVNPSGVFRLRHGWNRQY